MTTISDIINAMKNLNNSVILGKYPSSDIFDLRVLYSNLSDSSFNAKLENSDDNMLCQGMTFKFQKILDDLRIKNDYVFIRNNPILVNREGFNSSSFFDRGSNEFFTCTGNFFEFPDPDVFGGYGTHSLVEILLEGEYFLCDPYACVFYKTDIKNLIDNPMSTYYFGYSQGHLDWLLEKDIHINRSHRIYATPIFWESVVDVSYGNNGNRSSNIK